jgi:hypothetical protein
MPDADIIHNKLNPRYQKFYKQICEWSWNPEHLGYQALRPLKKDIEHYGDAPIQIIKKAYTHFAKLTSTPLFLPIVNRLEENRYLDDLGRNIIGRNNRGKNLAIKACKEMLYEMHNGRFLGIARISQPKIVEQLLVKYFLMIYRSNFEECAPQTSLHYLDVDQEIFSERLDIIHPFIESGIKGLALQVVRSGSVAHIRIPKKPRKVQHIDLETNILDI